MMIPPWCQSSLWLVTSLSFSPVWGFKMSSALLPGSLQPCVTLYLSSVLNSVPDLPSIRRAAVQAWLETVSGGSLVMFVPSPLTITILSRQLRWYLNTRILVLLLVHAEVAGRRAGGGTCMPHSGSPSLHGPDTHPTPFREGLEESLEHRQN